VVGEVMTDLEPSPRYRYNADCNCEKCRGTHEVRKKLDLRLKQHGGLRRVLSFGVFGMFRSKSPPPPEKHGANHGPHSTDHYASDFQHVKNT
jgi:hypothetical protein